MCSLQYYKDSALSQSKSLIVLKKLQQLSSIVTNIETETCYYVNCSAPLGDKDKATLEWVLGSTSFTDTLTVKSNLRSKANGQDCLLIEIGPLLNFASPYSSNAVAIFTSLGLKVNRVERTTLYLIHYEKGQMNEKLEKQLVSCLHDRMTQQRYQFTGKNIFTSSSGKSTGKDWTVVDILGKGKEALVEINDQMGLSFDDWDLDYYTKMFKTDIKRNPTSVECFDLAQSNSEHSRHWFFRGVSGNLSQMLKA